MTPQAFIAKWRDNPLSEKAGAQTFFLDLCDLLGVAKPNDPDNYCFERGLSKTGAAHGWADVWKRGAFAWESKAPGKDLGLALKQLMTYALALDNPPLLVVSDRMRIEIHTHFTGTPSEVHPIPLEEIGQPQNLQKLRWLFEAPENFKPKRSTYAVTEEAAARMGALAKRLTDQGNDPQRVAHFLIQCVFCMFAEDAKLLPEKLFETVLDKSNPDGEKAKARLTQLFEAMRDGGDFAMNDIPWFNGGLFKHIEVPALATQDVVQLLQAARMGWGEIEPAILGTLFERGLNPDMRSQLGAHYTDPATILKLIRPVVEQPLLAEWQATKVQIAALQEKAHQGGKGSKGAKEEAQNLFIQFMQRLKNYRVLDPACGSGNFLYLALKTLKDLEHRANLEAESLGLHRELGVETSPANVLGIELNPYAAELARVTVWIGEIQWMLTHGYALRRDPILRPLDHIECRDAVLDLTLGTDITTRDEQGDITGTKGQAWFAIEPEWPAVDAIVGNPPFLGDKKMRAELGDEYTDALRRQYEGRVPGGADFVTYWFEKARAQIEAGKTKRAGLVGTNSIRGGASRRVLERILDTTRIFEAWGDEPWVNNGAAVRVSLVCFGDSQGAMLDGQPVATIHADLTTGASGLDLTKAHRLEENANVCFEGIKKYGSFDISGELARSFLKQGGNPNGHSNSKVLRPWINATDVVRKSSDTWIIDFTGLSVDEAMLYEAPFQHVLAHVKPEREKDRNARTRENWWLFERPRPDMRRAIEGLPRYIVTPVVSKHRIFAWRSAPTLAMNLLDVIARANDTTFGILHSRFHELWSLRMGTSLEDRPRYTPTTTFETFPFPAGLTPRDTAVIASDAKQSSLEGSAKTSGLPRASGPRNDAADRIAAAAKKLNEQREAWLNPPEWVDWVRTPEEEKAGFPSRPVAKPDHEADLKKRTLTNLYNARPAWLDNAHKELDAAVAAAYGWTDYTPEMADEEILKRLLALNLERADFEEQLKIARGLMKKHHAVLKALADS